MVEIHLVSSLDTLVKPRVTGWAQINGRDDLPTPTKVEFDVEYLARQSLLFDLKILSKSVTKVLGAEGVNH